MGKNILVTGGAGYVGSHACLEFLSKGNRLVVLDNFQNSSPQSLARVCKLAGPDASNRLKIIKGDIRSASDLEQAFSATEDAEQIDAVVHFAGLKSVSESVENPLIYWDVNVNGSRQLLETMRSNNCRTIVFSSSATIYGLPKRVPIRESARVQPINPYGNSKAAVEQMLADLALSESGWRIARLRYFNPVGAHSSGEIGEDPTSIPSNLFPFVSQVAVGRHERLHIFGGDWPTHDGSGVRDYIHVMDLAEGHCATVNVLLDEAPQLLTVNLGSGKGHSVLDVVAAFEQASGRSIPYKIVDRRPGDAPSSVADPSLAIERLGWRTKRTIAEMCRDSWAWQHKNPYGFEQKSSCS